jgi:hypothetical protein
MSKEKEGALHISSPVDIPTPDISFPVFPKLSIMQQK